MPSAAGTKAGAILAGRDDKVARLASTQGVGLYLIDDIEQLQQRAVRLFFARLPFLHIDRLIVRYAANTARPAP